jgi:hypothetical protein
LRSHGHRRSSDLEAPWLRSFIPLYSFGADPVAASSSARGHEGASLLGPEPSSLRELGLALPVEVPACATSLPGARPPHRLSPPDSSSTMDFSAGSSCSSRRWGGWVAAQAGPWRPPPLGRIRQRGRRWALSSLLLFRPAASS